ncbi:MAG: glycosyltransferase family 2 protein, partial [Gemmatimonadota bacterium]
HQPGSGPGLARNRGAEEARGEILVFLDDDCVPDPDWLAELDLALAASPGAGVGGHTVNALPGNPYSSASQALIDYLYEYYNREAAREPMFTTSNLALPRTEFARIGGFDRRFSLAGGEDRELCLRWARSGRELRYAPGAIVRHAHRLSLRGFLRQHFTYGRGAARFHRIRGSGPIPEPASFYRELILYPWRDERRGRARMSALLALSQIANAAGYAWELRPRASRL